MESGSDNSSQQDTSTFTKELEEPAANQMRILWWKQQNWSMLKKALQRQRNPVVSLVCYEDLVPQMIVTNCLQRIGSRPIIFQNSFPLVNQDLLSHNQLKYIEYIIVTRDTANLGMSNWQVIQTISYIVQASSYIQADIHLDRLIREKWLPNLKRSGRVIKAQITTTERLRICVSQQ